MARNTDKNENKTKSSKTVKPSNSSNTAVTWSIRSVEIESRQVILKAAERSGKTIGKYISEDIMGFCQSQLSHTRSVSAPKDIQNQIDHLTSIIETISARLPEVGKKSLWKKLFSS